MACGGILGKDKKTFWKPDYDTEEDALNALKAYHVNESLSEDGSVAYSSAGIAWKTSTVKSILSWLCYDACQSPLNDFVRAMLIDVDMKVAFEFKSMSMPAIVRFDGTPDLTSTMLQSIVGKTFNGGYIAQLFDSTGASTIVITVDGEWCICNNKDIIAALFASIQSISVVYEASKNLPINLPNLKRPANTDIGFGSLFQKCKTWAAQNIATASICVVKELVSVNAHPSIAQNAIAPPSNNEFLSTVHNIILKPDMQFIVVDVASTMYVLYQKRWYKLDNLDDIAMLTSKLHGQQPTTHDVESLTQFNINEILKIWQLARPLSVVASVRTLKSDIEVSNQKEESIVLHLAPNIDIPAMVEFEGKAPNRQGILTFFYAGNVYKKVLTHQEDLTKHFTYIDLFLQSFQF